MTPYALVQIYLEMNEVQENESDWAFMKIWLFAHSVQQINNKFVPELEMVGFVESVHRYIYGVRHILHIFCLILIT